MNLNFRFARKRLCTKQLKSDNQHHSRRWLTVAILEVCLIAVMICGCQSNHASDVTTAAPYDPYDGAMTFTGVIKAIDLDGGTMTFISMDGGKQYDLQYNSGVNVVNKYEDVMAASALEIGDIVDITYNTNNNKLVDIAINPDAWEVNDISGLTFDRVNHQISILNTNYSYDNDLIINSNGKLIEISEVCEEDEITAKGYGGSVYSLTIDLGHGYVKLEDYDTYVGGMIEIGYDVIVPVTENMLLTVREGNYKLKITKGENSGYKSLEVVRDETNTVSLKELQIAPESVGELFFDVTPADARVMIDGETIDTSQTIQLTYGRHQIKVTADGYETKSGYFTVDSAYRIFTIELDSEDSDDDDSDDSSDTGTDSTTSTSTSDSSTDSSSSSSTSTEGDATTETTGYTVTINKPVGAYCYVDGDYKGTVPCTFDKTVGSHVVTFSMTGCLVKSYTITCLDNNKDDTYSFDNLETYSSVLFEEDDDD